jgi:hypothetical protein
MSDGRLDGRGKMRNPFEEETMQFRWVSRSARSTVNFLRGVRRGLSRGTNQTNLGVFSIDKGSRGGAYMFLKVNLGSLTMFLASRL